MINRLRRRFITLGTLSILILLSILIIIINFGNYKTVVSEIDRTIDVLDQPNIPFFQIDNNEGQKDPRDFEKEFRPFLPIEMSIEVPYESRFFTIEINPKGQIVDKDISRIISLSEDSIEKYVQKAIANNNEKGFVDNFRYKKTVNGNNTKIIFFDSGRKLETFYSFLKISIIFGSLGCVISFVIFILVSKRVVEPISKNYEKQKQFITDAGHEIKTPLTIIGANTDLLETEYGNNESIDDIKEQINKLKDLTNDLVYLSSADEQSYSINKEKIDLSDIVINKIDEFSGLAMSKQLEIKSNVDNQIYMNGSTNGIEKLISILLDNAIKYTDSNGIININLSKKLGTINLEISNTFNEKYSDEELVNIFERFYRTDSSRNSETGGSGIGLSIAKAIVESHKGNILATIEDGYFKINIKLSSI